MKRHFVFRFIAALLCGVPGQVLSQIQVQREVNDVAFVPGTRKRIAERMLMYPEIQYKYGLFQNFLGGYVDRPLFFDRATRYKGNFQYITPDSYFRDIEIMKMHGFDGGGSLANAFFIGKNKFFLENEPERAGQYFEFPQFSYGESGKYTINIDKMRNVLKAALDSKFAPKIKGRIPISTYNSGYIDINVMKDCMAKLKQEFGDTFAICGGLEIDHADNSEFQKNGSWSSKTQEKYRQRIEDILNTFDGIQLRLYTERSTNNYMFEPDMGIHDAYLQQMLDAMLAKPEYAEKLVCGRVISGYINHLSGVTQAEFGTRRARMLFDRLAHYNCDLIFMFEWNEFNENTCWQPTLYNSLVLQRLTKYYAHKMRGEAPAPNPSDDLSLPQLTVSTRENYKAGEPVRFEMLNIPDTEKSAMYTAKLALHDMQGNVATEFPLESFDRAKMREVVYTLPSEAFASTTILLPSLEVSRSDGSIAKFALQHLRILPSFCYIYKEMRQSVRDILVPQKSSFSAKQAENNTYQVSASIQLPDNEILSSLEVLDCGREVYALDPQNEFDREANMILVMGFSTNRSKRRPVKIEFAGVPDFTVREWGFPNVSFGNDWKKIGSVVEGSMLIWRANNRFIVTIPKQFVAKGKVTVTVDGETAALQLAELARLGTWSHAFPKCRLELEDYQKLPDIAVRSNTTRGEFSVQLKSTHQYPMYQLRAVTASGKIYRSTPIIPVPVPSHACTMNVFSETTGKVVQISVPDALVPDINYIFNPEAGATLRNDCDPYFNGALGGGYAYCGAYSGGIPVPPGNHAPEWKTLEDGKFALYFDGDSYLHFEPETFPRGAFTVECEIKPEPEETTENYVLFRHFGRILGSITVFAKANHVCFAFGDHDLKTTEGLTTLELPPGKWSRLTISYDLDKMKITVDSKSQEFMHPGLRALYFKPFIFGGHTKNEFGLPRNAAMFKGELKKLRIVHNAVE